MLTKAGMDLCQQIRKVAMFSAKNTCRLILLFGFIFLFVVAGGCGNKGKGANDSGQSVSKTAKKPAIKVKMTPLKKSVKPQKGTARFAAFIKGTEHLEKFDKKPENCKTFCSIWCPLAAKCGMPVMHNPAGCKKICYDPCTKGLLAKSFASCVTKAKDCPDVKGCFKALRTKIEKTAKAPSNKTEKNGDLPADPPQPSEGIQPK